MSMPELRWNLILLGYMPFMSGLWFDFEWLFEDARQAYIQYEYENNPHLFKQIPIIEIRRDEYTYDKFLKLSNNLREPILVKGLFNDSIARQTFGTDDWINTYKNFTIKSVDKSTDPKNYKYSYSLKDENFG